MFKISNEKESFVMDGFRNFTDAITCFPDREVKMCSETPDYKSFSDYAKFKISKLDSKYENEDLFIVAVQKLNITLAYDGIAINPDSDNNKEGEVVFYLHNDRALTYNYYIDEFGDFSLGDFISEEDF